jgi:hypothetical protein
MSLTGEDLIAPVALCTRSAKRRRGELGNLYSFLPYVSADDSKKKQTLLSLTSSEPTALIRKETLGHVNRSKLYERHLDLFNYGARELESET